MYKMKCLIIFDYMNDIVYTKYNRKFAKHINKFARAEGLLPDETENEPDNKLASNVLMQIFSPIVTSQRIMSSQFGNSYTSCQCQSGLNIAFEEYMGYIFMNISQEEIAEMKRLLGIGISFVRHLCGADVHLLQSSKSTASTLTRLLDTWLWLRDNEQSMLIEAVEQLSVNPDLSSATIRALQDATDKLKSQLDHTKIHAMILVQNKFLALYSSRHAQELSAADILFLSMLSLCGRHSISTTGHADETDTDCSDEFFSPSTSPEPPTPSPDTIDDPVTSYQVLLMGTDPSPKCLPHAVHIVPLTEDVNLMVMVESGVPVLSSGLHEAFLYLTILQTVQVQRDIDTLRPAFDNLDIAIKKTSDGLKKLSKQPVVEASHKRLTAKWDFMKKKYQEFVKTGDCECLLRAESSTGALLDCLRELLAVTCFDTSMLHASCGKVVETATIINDRLAMFSDFFKAKAMKNLSLGSASLTINKYLEEFPGMVHFLYVDRTNHRVTAPSLDFNSEETISLTKKKIWSMVRFSRCHLQQGHLSIMWKDTTFNYAYFLWFEDKAGAPLKPRVFPTNSSRVLPQSGILCGDFYQRLTEVCFPKMAAGKVRCFELFCIHLGLATSSVVLEQTRRLAATIWEVTGGPTNPLDLI